MGKFLHIVLMIGAFFIIVALALTTFEVASKRGGNADDMQKARNAQAAKRKVAKEEKQEIEDEIEEILDKNGKN